MSLCCTRKLNLSESTIHSSPSYRKLVLSELAIWPWSCILNIKCINCRILRCYSLIIQFDPTNLLPNTIMLGCKVSEIAKSFTNTTNYCRSYYCKCFLRQFYCIVINLKQLCQYAAIVCDSFCHFICHKLTSCNCFIVDCVVDIISLKKKKLLQLTICNGLIINNNRIQ